MKEKKAIGVFDSGVGGLTVLKEIHKLLPHEEIIYYGDNKRAPYGSRKNEEIVEFSLEIGRFLQEQGVKIVVIACNTATAVALEELSRKIELPIVGVIKPGAMEAVERTKNGKVGVFATPLTVKVEAYKKRINKISKEIIVDEIGCPPLCKMIESEWQDTEENQEIVNSYAKKLDPEVDVVIFGCTHYPIIKEYFKRVLPNKIFVNPGKETAKLVKRELESRNQLNKNKDEGSLKFYTSGEVERFKRIGELILGKEISVEKNNL